MALRLGVDIGGTFTDFTVLNGDGSISIWKEDTTHDNPTRAIDSGFRSLADQMGVSVQDLLSEASILYHGTTIATNQVIERTGALVGLLCTKGFRDVLYFRNGFKPERFNMHLPHPKDFAERRLRLGISERIDSQGDVVTALDEVDVRRSARLFKEAGVAAVAVAFLWSVVNPCHEKRAAEIVAEEMPGVHVLCSSDVLPEIREWERTSATVLSAYLLPGLYDYLEDLGAYLSSTGLRGEPLLMQINGGCATIREVLKSPVNMLHSGPAAGPAAGLAHAREVNERNIITIDMGGTSFDVCLVRDGQPAMSRKMLVEDQPIGVAAVDVHSVGAGGGSIAWIDPGGALRVGPQSAGSKPGPAAYGFGGGQPTVTDANVVLGYLDPAAFLGGRRRLRRDLSEQAITEHIAKALGLNTIAAAHGILKVVDTNMVNAIRAVSVEKGIDPRDYLIVVGGGAGGLHASRLAREIGIRRVLIPRDAGVFCASGMLVTDVRHDSVAAYHATSDEIDLHRLDDLFMDLERSGAERLRREGFADAQTRFDRWVDARYLGQVHEVTIPVPRVHRYSYGEIRDLASAFHQHHLREFAYARPELPVEFLHWRVNSFGCTTQGRTLPETLLTGDPQLADEARVDDLKAFFQGTGLVSTPAFDSSLLRPGAAIAGPAIVQAPTTTVVVNPGDSLMVNGEGSYVIDIEVDVVRDSRSG